MPRIKRQNLPRRLFEHLEDRVRLRKISAEDLIHLRDWLDTNPEVPEVDWFKAFDAFFVCGHGALIKTFLPKGRLPLGQEIP
jgi:hypothetical protein